jgi:hypothetical protein
MTFLELDIGDYFIQWDIIDGCYYMYWKKSEYDAQYVDTELNSVDWGIFTFGADSIVYKVIV